MAGTTCDFVLIPKTDEKGSVQEWTLVAFTDSDKTMETLTDTLDQYPEPLAYYFDKDTKAEYLTYPRDYGKDMTGTFEILRDVHVLRGSCTEEHHLKTEAASDWDIFDSLVVSSTARYQRYYAFTDGPGNVLYIEKCIRANFWAKIREEEGQARSSSTGPTVVNLQGDYAAWKDVRIEPISSQALITAWDNMNLETDTFDVYIYDLNNNLVEVDFKWRFRGI